MRGLGQIAWLASFTRPDVGADHEHRARAPRARRHGRERRARQGRADRGAAAGRHRGRARGAAARAVPHAHDIEIRRFGHVEEPGVFRVGDRAIRLETSYTARHQLDNTLAALIVCDVLGVPVEDGRARRSSSRRCARRSSSCPDGVLLINDCYNANPLSMRAALQHLAERAGDAAPRRGARRDGRAGRGGARLPPRRRRRGRRDAGVDELIARRPARARVRGRRERRRRRTTPTPPPTRPTRSRRSLRPGDVVLVKGSRAVGLEAVAAKLTS